MSNIILEGLSCTVYQYIEGMAKTDLIVLLDGRLTGDIQWSEGERTLSFTVENYYEDNEIGYAPQEGDIANLNPDVVGQPWPLCFGSPLKVPAVHIFRPQTGHQRSSTSSSIRVKTVSSGQQYGMVVASLRSHAPLLHYRSHNSGRSALHQCQN